MTPFRIVIPGAYLDAYRAAPSADAPAGLDALLMTADTVGEGRSRRALVDVPDDLLPALAAVARDHFLTWGTGRAGDARAAFAVHTQAKHRRTLQDRPTVPDAARPCRHCASPDTVRTTARPPHKHNGPCLPECERPAVFCRNCRMLDTV